MAGEAPNDVTVHIIKDSGGTSYAHITGKESLSPRAANILETFQQSIRRGDAQVGHSVSFNSAELNQLAKGTLTLDQINMTAKGLQADSAKSGLANAMAAHKNRPLDVTVKVKPGEAPVISGKISERAETLLKELGDSYAAHAAANKSKEPVRMQFNGAELETYARGQGKGKQVLAGSSNSSFSPGLGLDASRERLNAQSPFPVTSSKAATPKSGQDRGIHSVNAARAAGGSQPAVVPRGANIAATVAGLAVAGISAVAGLFASSSNADAKAAGNETANGQGQNLGNEIAGVAHATASALSVLKGGGQSPANTSNAGRAYNSFIENIRLGEVDYGKPAVKGNEENPAVPGLTRSEANPSAAPASPAAPPADAQTNTPVAEAPAKVAEAKTPARPLQTASMS